MTPEPTGPADAGLAAPAPPAPAGHISVPSFDADAMSWSGPAQQGCIEADPFVMWIAVTFVTIVTILYFFLRGVKRPSSRDKG